MMRVTATRQFALLLRLNEDLFELEVCLKWTADSTSAEGDCSTGSSQIGSYHYPFGRCGLEIQIGSREI